MSPYVNIHTHRPTGRGIELRTAGIHPWDAASRQLVALAGQLDSEPFDALGETGLDRCCPVAWECQMEVFREQLRMACQRELPVVIHCVRAFEPIMHELALLRPRAVIFHGFIGSPQQARRAYAEGFFLSFGWRTFASPKSLAALTETPLPHLFLETDDDERPIEALYARIAVLRGITTEELKQATWRNYNTLFEIQNGQLAGTH